MSQPRRDAALSGSVCYLTDCLGVTLGRANRAGLSGSNMGSKSSCAGRGRPHPGASSPDKEGAILRSQACNSPARDRHRVSILWCHFVGAQFWMFLPSLRRREKLSVPVNDAGTCAFLSGPALELISVHANSKFRRRTARFPRGKRSRESTRIARAASLLCQTSRELFRRG
jgi:hypothetical protein